MSEGATTPIGNIAIVTDFVANGSFEALRNNVTYKGSSDHAVLVRLVDHNAGWNGNYVYVDKASYDFLAKSSLTPGDVIIANVGANAGTVFRVPNLGLPATLGPNAILCKPRDESVIQRDFLYYLLISPAGQHAIGTIIAGSAQPKFNKTDFRSLKVALPTIREQRAISSILVALDDKIELNRRMNETLEAMARAIFKDWFVDFGPTRAKMEGRAPYLAPEIWALFPEKLDDEGKPDGWESGELGKIAKQAGESVSPTELSPDTPYIGLEHMPRRSIALDSWEGAGKVTSGKLAFKRGDILFGKLRPYFHKVGIAPLDGICSTDIVVLNATQPAARSYVIACVSQDEFVEFANRTSDGTKMPRTSWGKMAKFETIIPSPELLEAYNAVGSRCFERIVANVHQSRTLAATRDLLLPKLMSGEIRVRDAENVAEAAA